MKKENNFDSYNKIGQSGYDLINTEFIYQLKRCNIHMLREQGAKLGVKSVTTHSKDKLIELIVQRRAEIDTSVGSAGAMSKFITSEEHALLSELSKNAEGRSGDTITGTLELDEEGEEGFVRIKLTKKSHRDVYVSSELIQECRLRTGDIIEGKAIPLPSHDFRGLISINRLNNNKPDNYLRKSFNCLQSIPPFMRIGQERELFERTNRLSESDKIYRMMNIFSPLARGQRNLIMAQHPMDLSELIVQVAKSLMDGGVDTQVFVFNEGAEVKDALMRKLNDSMLVTDSEAGREEAYRRAHLSIERQKRQAEMGNHTAILVTNITGFSFEEEGEDYKTLFRLGRQLQGGGSLTIIGFAHALGVVSRSICEELIPLANSLTVISGSKRVIKNNRYNPIESYSDFYSANPKERERYIKTCEYLDSRPNGEYLEEDIINYYNSLTNG